MSAWELETGTNGICGNPAFPSQAARPLDANRNKTKECDITATQTATGIYTVRHPTATTALKQMDARFETVAASLKQPFYRTFLRLTIPACTPAILDIGIYLFVSDMTTVSAIVFVYSLHTTLAPVAVLNMDDAGDITPAAAMGMMIIDTAAGVKILHYLLSRGIEAKTQTWRSAVSI